MKRKILLLTTAVLFSVASAFAQGGTAGPLTWQLSGMSPYYTLTISGNGEMPDYEYWSNAPWYEYNYSIFSVVVENGVTRIGNYAFNNCSALTISISKSVVSMGYSVFSGCNSLTAINVEAGNPYFSSIDGVLFDKDKNILLTYPSGKAGSYTVPNSVMIIRESAFSQCQKLTSVTLGNSVAIIGEYAFYNCTALTAFNVENGNPNYSSDNGVLFNKDKTTLFYYPAGKTAESYTIPNSVMAIESNAFINCKKLASLTFGNSVATIGYSAFSNCTALTSVILPNSVTTIGSSAFNYCTALTSVTFGIGLTEIGYDPFYGCYALTSINVENGNPNYSSENGVLFNKDKTTLIKYPAGKIAENYAIPNSVITIADDAFLRCQNLTSIVIPNSVTTIKSNAFYRCEKLTSVTFGNSITTIEYSAFSYCEKLTSITIPNSVTTIESYAFSGCEKLTSVTLGNSVTTFGYSVFSWCQALTLVTNLNPKPIDISSSYVFSGVEISACTLKVLKNSVSAYQAAEIWQEFNIVGGTFLLVGVSINNNEYGTATGGGYYEANETVTLNANAFSGYKFVNWTKDGVVVSTNNPYNFTVTEDINLVANFEKEVGVVESQCIASLQIYPNPTTGELTIDNGQLTIKGIEIYDVSGRKLYEQEVNLTLLRSYALTVFPAGVYFVRIQTEAGEVVRKVLKK